MSEEEETYELPSNPSRTSLSTGSKSVKSLHELLAAKNNPAPTPSHPSNQFEDELVNDSYVPQSKAGKALRFSQEVPEFGSEMRNSNLVTSFPPPKPAEPSPSDGLLQAQSSSHMTRVEEDEEEMPSSSFTVLGDDSDLLKLLSGANTPMGKQAPDSSLDYNNHYYNNNSNGNNNGKNSEEIIELYSTIAMLKKENGELMKELEFVKKSKDAMLNDQLQKNDVHASRLRAEIQEQQAVAIRIQREKEEMEREMEMMRSDMECLMREKQDLEQNVHRNKDDSSTVRSDLAISKQELNKLRMEMGRMKADNDRLTSENNGLNNEIQQMLDQKEQQDRLHDNELRDLQQNLRKAEEQALLMKNECLDKNQHIGRLTSDLQSMDRNLNGVLSENGALKQRVATLEMSERELSQARYHISTLENDYRNLQTELSQLRGQMQQSTGSSYSVPRAPYQPPPPPMPIHTPYQPPQPPQSYSSYEPSSYSREREPASSSSRSGTYSSGGRYGAGDDYASNNSYSSYNAPKENKPSAGGSSLASIVGGGPGKTAKSLSSALGDMSEIRKSMNNYDSYSSAPMPKSNESSSLGNLIQGKNKYGDEPISASITGEGKRKSLGQVVGGNNASTPFATDRTASELMSNFDTMERDLTRLMTEKTSLSDESERYVLHICCCLYLLSTD